MAQRTIHKARPWPSAAWPRALALLALVMLLVGGGLSASPGLSAQDAALAPQVIDVWPLPGVELAPQDTLTLTFDWPMDAASVEAAFGIEPALDGALTWADARTVSFAPTNGWPLKQLYTVTVGAEAQSTQGVTLAEPYTVNVVTAMPLGVALVAPEDGAENIAAGARITVSFDRPVVPLVYSGDIANLPTPITLSPPVVGTGEWVNTSIYTFTPETFLDAATTYTVTVADDLVASDGRPLDAGYRWSFRTELPRVVSFPLDRASEADPETEVAVTFSVPMNQPSAQAAFNLTNNLGDAVSGRFLWEADGRTMKFIPDARLDLQTDYNVTVSQDAQAARGDGGGLEEAFSARFTTMPFPGVRDTNPRSGEGNIDLEYRNGIAIHFRTPMKREGLMSLVSISPTPSDLRDPYTGGAAGYVRSLWLNFTLQYETRYTVTLKAGAEDRFGNRIPEDYTFSFTTGSLRPRAYPIVTGGLMSTSAYREDTQIGLRVTGTPTVDFELYRLTPEQLSGSVRYGYGDFGWEREAMSWLDDPDALLRTWAETYDSDGLRNVPVGVPLASPEGGSLPAGLYHMRVYAPRLYSWQDYASIDFTLSVITTTLTVKRSHNELLVWATDLLTGAPVPNAPITVYNQGRVLFRGTTDAEGIYRAPLDLVQNAQAGDYEYWRSSGPGEGILVVAEGEGIYGVWYSSRENVLTTTRAYLYTDRPIYRPGETVYFRAILRDRLDMTYTPPDVDEVEVTLGNWEQQFASQTVEVTDFGTLSGQFVIPEDAPLGTMDVNVLWGGQPFESTYCYDYGDGYDPECYSSPSQGISLTVAEFRVPEYEVSLTPATTSVIQGEPVNALLDADYYFGGGVANANVEWRLELSRGSYAPPGFGGYSFFDETLGAFSNDLISGTGVTDAEGTFLITSSDTAGVLTPYPGIPLSIRAFATIADESEQGISASTRITAHPGEVYVGIRYGDYFGTLNEAYSFELVAANPDGTPVAEQVIDLEVVETQWTFTINEWGGYDWSEEVTPVATGRAVTDAEGVASYSFTPTKAGSYRLRALTRDDQERASSSTRRLYVPGRERVRWGRPSSSSDTSLTLIRDQDSYAPGDTARIIIPVPFENGGYALVTTERSGILTTEVVQTTDTSIEYEVVLTDADAPNVYVTAWMVAGPDPAVAPGDPASYPRYASGTLSLNVEPVDRKLTVEITPSSERVSPGDTLAFDLRVTDHEGAPVVAEVGLKLTDEAVLDLLADNARPLFSSFYFNQGLLVSSSNSLSVLMDALLDALLPGEGGKGGAGSPGGGPLPSFDIRDDFIITPLWAPHVITDSDGRARVEVTMPDNLTRFVADARVVTMDTKLAHVTTKVTSTLPLIVRPAVPRFFVVGDQTELAVVINNNTGQDQVITARIEASGVRLDDPASQDVMIPAGGRGRATWTAVVEDVRGVDLTFFASNADGTQTDAAKPALTTGEDDTIPVYRYTAPDTVATSGFLGEAGAVTEAVSVPARLVDDADGDLVVTLDPSLAVTMVDALDYLERFEHECVEQTISRFLPNTVTYKALVDLGIDDPGLRANLLRVNTEALERLLRVQNPDGGYGWFPFRRSNTYVSAYAMLGFVESAGSGLLYEATASLYDRDTSPYPWPDDVMARLDDFLARQVINLRIGTPQWELSRQAFVLYARAVYGQWRAEVNGMEVADRVADLDALFVQRERLTNEARAFLLLSYALIDPDNANVTNLVADLNSSVILSATGAHWEETRDDYGWGTSIRTTTLALKALIAVQPDNPLLPNAVRWLMVARERRHWPTTQETAWAVMALTDWMVSTGELNGNYDYAARFNNAEIADGQVTPDTVRDQTQLVVDVRDLLLQEVSTLTLARGEGEGALYYTAYLNLNLLAEEVEGINRGVGVTREYFNAAGEPITSATAGDTINVRLTVNVPQNVTYFVLNDPLPAGLESLDPNLLTNVGADTPTLSRDDSRWYWYYWAWDHTELRDDRTSLYAESLRRGTYVFSYQARAVTPGVYQTRPAHAYEFYFPEVFGRTDGSTFTVLERPAGAPEADDAAEAGGEG